MIRRPVFFGWTIVGALGITTIVSYGTTSYAFGVLLAPVAEDQGWSRAAISGAYALGILVAGVLGVPIGLLVDRFGGRLLMSAGSALGGMALIALSMAQGVREFDLLWGVGLGLASALTFYPVSFTIVANWFEYRRGAALAWLTTLGGLASPIFIPATAWLVAQVGWRQSLFILGLAQLAVGLPLHALVVRRHPEDLGLRPDGRVEPGQAGLAFPATDPRSKGVTAHQALRSMVFWSLTLAAGIEQLAAMVVFAHQIALMISRGFDPVFAAGIAGLIGLASLPGRFLLNRLSDQYDTQLLLASVLATLGLGVVVITLADSAAWLYLYAVVYGIAFGARSSLRASVMAGHFGRRAYGAITAVQGGVISVPAAFGPLAAGWLYDRLGNYELAFWLTAAAFALAALLILLTPRPRLDSLAL
ncbi:MAG TPA: MFS transporter [Chloroflexota bacterium]|nr:MFS transporter [Chloroflexota bacterium]